MVTTDLLPDVEVDLGALASDAARGEVPWVVLAIHERALLGAVLYRTWAQLTPDQRTEVGMMSQRTARRKLHMP